MLWQLRCTWELLTVPGLRRWGGTAAFAHSPDSRAKHLSPIPQGLFLSRPRPSWPMVPALPFSSHPRTGPGGLLGVCCTSAFQAQLCVGLPTLSSLTSRWAEETTPAAHSPASSLLCLCLKVQPLLLSPSPELGSEPTLLPLQRVLKPLCMNDVCLCSLLTTR